MLKAVQNKSELIERIHVNEKHIRSFGVIRLGIFGSFVKNMITSESDVDFFIEFDPSQKTFDNFMELGFYLENLSGRKIEIVTPESLNKFIGKYIIKEVEYVSLSTELSLWQKQLLDERLNDYYQNPNDVQSFDGVISEVQNSL